MPIKETPASSLQGAGYNHTQCFKLEAHTKGNYINRISRRLYSLIFCVELLE